MNRTAFERDFRDLHGDDLEAVAVGAGRYRVVQTPPTIEKPGLRLIIGALGLFWAIIMGVVVLGVIGAAVLAVWALATT